MRLKTVYRGLAELCHLPLFLPTIFLPEIFSRFCKAAFVALFRFRFCEFGVYVFRFRVCLSVSLCKGCLWHALSFPVFLALFVFPFRVCRFLHACPVTQMPWRVCCLLCFPVTLMFLVAIVFLYLRHSCGWCKGGCFYRLFVSCCRAWVRLCGHTNPLGYVRPFRCRRTTKGVSVLLPCGLLSYLFCFYRNFCSMFLLFFCLYISCCPCLVPNFSFYYCCVGFVRCCHCILACSNRFLFVGILYCVVIFSYFGNLLFLFLFLLFCYLLSLFVVIFSCLFLLYFYLCNMLLFCENGLSVFICTYSFPFSLFCCRIFFFVSMFSFVEVINSCSFLYCLCLHRLFGLRVISLCFCVFWLVCLHLHCFVSVCLYFWRCLAGLLLFPCLFCHALPSFLFVLVRSSFGFCCSDLCLLVRIFPCAFSVYFYLFGFMLSLF